MVASFMGEMILASEVAVVNGFRDADPDVDEADAGDDASDGSFVEEGGKPRIGGHERVVVPEAGGPGQNHDQDAEVDAEEDEHTERDALQPDGRGLFCVFAADRRFGCFGRFRSR